jgi:glyoxylase-like metal-dependent hydrolase (beta-lactamase superfamily II)
VVDRRHVIKGGLAGALTLWASPLLHAYGKLTDTVSVLDGGGSNIAAFSSADGVVLVDTGSASNGARVMADLKRLGGNARVHTVFNTHHHTGNNDAFAAAGATIVAHHRTRQWMSVDYWLPDQDRYQKARPRAAWPTEVFFNTGSRTIGGEQIEYGYLPVAHTAGDIYVYFKGANVLAVGDVASPVNDPELDWITGAWIGGRVSAMDALLKIGNDGTRVVPGSGPVMTWAEFKAERELMEAVRQRLFKQVRQGDGPKEMVDGGVLKGLARTWQDPYKFLYAAAKGLWGNHNKLDPDVV